MGGDSFGGLNGFGGIFALLILLGLFSGGFGNGFGGNNGVNTLNADMQRGFDTQNLSQQTRDILGAVTSGTAQTIAASTQNAANAIINKFSEAVFGEEDKKVVIQFEGLPDLGTPEE